MPVLGTAASDEVIDQGELSVGAATVQLTATATPCSKVWVGAPTAVHTVGELNTSIILVGGASGGNASGGVTLATDDHRGFYMLVSDASVLYFTGQTSGDVVEYQILR